MRSLIIFIFLALNLFGVDAILSLSKTNKQNSFYEVQLGSFLSLEEARDFYFKLIDKIKDNSNIYKLNKYYSVRYGNARKTKNSLFNELKEIKNYFKDSYIVKINSQTLDKKIDLNEARETQTVQRIKDNYEYSDLIIKADELKSSNNLSKSIEIYEKLLNYKEDDLIQSNLFYLYGKTKNWQKAKEKILNNANINSLLYSYGVGAIENNSQALEDELKPFLNEDRSGYLSLILGVFFEKKELNYQAYEYYKSAYLKNSSDSYLIYSYARACELVGLFQLSKELYLNLSQNENIEHSIRENAYIRYIELSNI